MPAYRERVYICPSENGEPGWILDFPLWWDRGEFFREYNYRQFDAGNPIYVDYALLLSGQEARAWDMRSRERFTQDPRSGEAWFQEALQRWETLLRSASWVIVEMYEWESGLE